MKKSSLSGTVLTLLVITGVAIIFQSQITQGYTNLINILYPPKPCSQPIVYSLGTFDTQFGLTRNQFLQDIAHAVQIWDTPFGRTFFVYADDVSTSTGRFYGDTAKDSMKINLLYDYRQQDTNKMAAINNTINADNATYNSLRLQYTSEVSTFNAQKAALDAMVTGYNTQKNAYDQQVQYWNNAGGAPKDQYATLEQTRQNLNAQVDAINSAQASLSTLSNTVNATVATLNAAAKGVNSTITTYNTVGSEAGQQFAEGEYVQDSTGEYINIYQYDNQDKLIRVLAHELGHALGMQHVTDPNAIMYAVNEGAGGSLTHDDINELKRVCDIM